MFVRFLYSCIGAGSELEDWQFCEIEENTIVTIQNSELVADMHEFVKDNMHTIVHCRSTLYGWNRLNITWTSILRSGDVEWVKRRSIARWKGNSHAHLPRYPNMFEIILINGIFGHSVLHINPNIDLGCEFFLEKISQNDLSIQSESKKIYVIISWVVTKIHSVTFLRSLVTILQNHHVFLF